jgi:double-strand break repair protein MRE11
MDSIRLRSVRPFVFEDIVLSQVIPEPSNAKGDQNKLVVSRCLKAKVEEMIAKANAEYMELHPEADEEAQKRMIPLIRLRVRCSSSYLIPRCLY